MSGLLGFAKAFDKVAHTRLEVKLKSCGAGANILSWIKNWLMERRQKVGTKGMHSEFQMGKHY